jgi:hypothetical protein
MTAPAPSSSPTPPRPGDTVEDRLANIEMVLFGNQRLDYAGVMKRVADIEGIIKRWQRMEWMLAGALTLMGLTTAANMALVARLLNWVP